MKNLKLYKESIKKVIASASALVMLSMTSCGAKIEPTTKVYEKETITTSTTDVVEPTVEKIDGEGAGEYVSDYSKTGVYTETDYSNFIKDAYETVKDININITEKDFNTAVLMLNQEYLTNTEKEETQLILDNYFLNSEGVNIYDDANQLYQLLAEVRNYNTEYYADNKIYSFTNLLIPELLPEEELSVIRKLEEYVSIVREYYKETKNAPTKDEVKKIFNEVKKFGLGEGRINGKTQVELSNGAIFVTENLVQEISVMCQNVVSEKSRNELDKKLNSLNGLFNLENAWSDMAYYIGRVEPIEKDGQTEALYISIELMRENLKVESITDEQLNALFAIANIDYFLKDTRNLIVFKELYGEDFDLMENYKMAYAAVKNIYSSNISYDFSKLFIDSKEDTIVAQGVMSAIKDLSSNDTNKIANGAQFLLDFSKYSNLATVNAYDPETEENLRIDKNSLTKGGTQIVNWMTLFAMEKYSTAINNQIIVDSTIGLVDGKSEISDIKSEIVVMYDEHCAINNPEEYKFEPEKVKTLTK